MPNRKCYEAGVAQRKKNGLEKKKHPAGVSSEASIKNLLVKFISLASPYVREINKTDFASAK
jgi:hypothetical protein